MKVFPPADGRYEYKVVPASLSGLSEVELNQFGSQGWVLVSTYPTLIFVRAIASTRVQPVRSTQMLTIKEVCQELRISPTIAYKLIYAGRLESIKIGRSRRVPARSLEKLTRETTNSALPS